MTQRVSIACFFAGMICFGGLLLGSDAKEDYLEWKVHDTDRPRPEKVDPGSAGMGQSAGSAPSDAVVLFNGESTDAFRMSDGSPIVWEVMDGSLVVKPRTGNIYTKQTFGDIQLHLEYMIPGLGQDRKGANKGNSGLFLMDRYEVQVISNEISGIYADGMAGAIYGQFPPLVNAERGLNQWQSYDIIFERPHFDEGGKLLVPAYITVLHNGVLVQNRHEIMGPTVHKRRTKYTKHSNSLPIRIQDHGDPVHYRNIWVRELAETAH